MSLLDRLRGWLRPSGPDPDDYPAGPVRDLVAALPEVDERPLPRVPLLAVDLETTGLDPDVDHVLSVGWVRLDGGSVSLADAREVLVAPPPGVDVGRSATIHGLTDDQVGAARPLEAVLPELLEALRGRVLVAHHARVETGFLAAATRRTWGCGLPLVAVDTLRLQRDLVADAHGETAPGALRLDAARRRFGLPRYQAHSAGLDAIAAAELLLAQAAEISHRRGRVATLRDVRASLVR
jgi:DNA polymerase-3 subunit epsilon